MPDKENLFDFGTGSINKDQWLRDIDNEQDAFISRYGNATNKHRTALLREAFADLRGRIASGDMLNRTADGSYQFGSALKREDKHMQEAYQRALGFMGDIARRQIQAPPAEPEKKAIGSLEERYIRSLNPSGKFNTEAYWKNQTDEERRASLKSFLDKELKDAETYNDFGGFGNKDTYTQRLQNVMTLLESGKANDWSLQQLGFTKNWLTLPTDETTEQEETKSELEQAQEAYQEAVAKLQAEQIRLQTAALTTPTPVSTTLLTFSPQLYWTLDSYLKGLDARIAQLRGIDELGNAFLKPGSIMGVTPMGSSGGYKYMHTTKTTKPTAWNGEAAQKAMEYTASQYNTEYNNALANYFKNLGVNYQTYLKDYNQRSTLMTNLAKLFAHTPGTQDGYVGLSTMNNLFTKLTDGTYGLKGTNLSYDPEKGILYSTSGIDNYGEGGVIKALNGYVFDSSKYIDSPKKQENTTTKETGQLSNSENARIAATIADIASMGAAFVPGYGTAASAVLGLGSTATNFGADLADGQGLWNATKNAGFGLAADVMGLIPGLGGVGKGAKIARNIMWAVPKMMQWVNTANGLANAGEIKNSILKLTSPSSMTVLDWLNVSQALQIMTGHGRSIATKVKKAGMNKTTTISDPEYYIFTNKGKQKVSDETFRKLREAKGSKDRQALTEELMGAGVTLTQTKGAPWNTSTRFGAFKEVPGRTQTSIYKKHKGIFSDENIAEKVENFNPSVDIRGWFKGLNPYTSAFNYRTSSIPNMYLRPTQVLPEGFGILKPVTKKTTLNDEQKQARAAKRALNKAAKEVKMKELEEMRKRNLAIGEKPDIPEAGSQAIARQTQATRKQLSSPYANMDENPGVKPINPAIASYNRRYGKAVTRNFGGALIALRHGGIIKAQWGDNTYDWTTPLYNPEILKREERAIYTNPYFPNIKYNGTAPWYKSRFSGESVVNLGEDASGRADLPGGLTGNNLDYAFARNQAYVKSGLLNKLADILGYFDLLPSPIDANNLQGLTDIYNKAIDELYLPFTSGKDVPDYLKTDATKHNLLFRLVYGSRAKVNGGDDNYDIGWNPDIIKTFGSASFARRPVNYETKWEDDLKNNLTLAKDRVSKISHNGIEGYVYTDENGRIHPLTNDLLKLLNGQQAPQKLDEEKKSSEVTDSERGNKSEFEPLLENPYDPTLGIIASKTIAGIMGNRNIYKNLLEEMPQVALRDPINRQLAIVGWQEAIKKGLNQLADLRRILQKQQGSNQESNFATALETERVGRDITDKSFMEDSGRLFETAQKLWNLKNEDTLYNLGVGDYNRRAIADRARMMAQIRAAWRSGDHNILMGALSDTGNWLMKRYQREQDVINLAREQQLGTRELYLENWVRAQHPDYDSLKAKLNDTKDPKEKDAIRNKLQEWQLEAIRKAPGLWSLKIYNTFHTPGFGGGFKEVLLKKNGGSLEKEKLKARGKDNDRYVSMIKDLRKSSRRRRRRFYHDD